MRRRARHEPYHSEALREPDENQSRGHRQDASRRYHARLEAVLGDEIGEPTGRVRAFSLEAMAVLGSRGGKRPSTTRPGSIQGPAREEHRS